VAAGLHTLAILPDGTDESALVRAAANRRVGVVGLESCCAGGEAPAPGAGEAPAPGGGESSAAPGLVLGYGNLAVPAIRRGMALLAEAAHQA
jgi:GntR family transcriptional regulator/MocR family aminotransferase